MFAKKTVLLSVACALMSSSVAVWAANSEPSLPPILSAPASGATTTAQNNNNSLPPVNNALLMNAPVSSGTPAPSEKGSMPETNKKNAEKSGPESKAPSSASAGSPPVVSPALLGSPAPAQNTEKSTLTPPAAVNSFAANASNNNPSKVESVPASPASPLKNNTPAVSKMPINAGLTNKPSAQQPESLPKAAPEKSSSETNIQLRELQKEIAELKAEKAGSNIKISPVNPFTGNSSYIAQLIKDKDLWENKSAVLKSMIKYEKNQLELQKLSSQNQMISNSLSPQVQSEMNQLESENRVLQARLQAEQAETADKLKKEKEKKIAESHPQLLSVFRIGNNYDALIKINGKEREAQVGDQIAGKYIKTISPYSVTFNDGEMISINYTYGTVNAPLWYGYPKKMRTLLASEVKENKPPKKKTNNSYNSFVMPHAVPFHLAPNTLPSMR